MKKHGLIYNPVSGHALFKGKLDLLIEMFQRHDILLCPYRTRGGKQDDLGRFLREVHPDGVLAAGGDGTVHAVVNAMLESETDVNALRQMSRGASIWAYLTDTENILSTLSVRECSQELHMR